MAADLDSLITSEIPEGRQNLLDSYTNLERVAEYCENNYFQCDNKRAALEETKGIQQQSRLEATQLICSLMIRIYNSITGKCGLPDQHPGLQLPADARPAVLLHPGDGVTDQPHQPNRLHPQGESGQKRNWRSDHQQVF